ncbi:L-idonate 5-dehydrogenase [Tanticharoenia sakaeratensis]|uniref:Alcohol dehydrogenase GroES domain-containing protein n=1 Tax=Tanticharoenia sakaeratensis NBRC 103193 TaxID=1231623 RepID=A0A0D6MJH9_9PROT|nr:L-idonate 5-dehydrogenase [Tanticharoenia sakaeratensis]GAN53804.1 alcohol dehydrogenase GroES domain-containing protein [Tanticharoenia sakaeratensis NBRC 103193]GBQ22318.1 threonine dehydrogenase [Tanticharoenia sakaeratensis NBRC 103193]
MHAVVIHAPHDLRVTPYEAERPGPGQVRVRIEAGGICGSDLHYYHHGGFGAIRVREPMVIGHEIAGTIVELGPDVDKLAVGDHVAVNPSRPCGHCAMCRNGLFNHCTDMRFYGSAMRTPHVQGGFREELVCDASQCFVGTRASTSTLSMAEPFAVALHAVSRAGSLLGKRVLVTGCGPIGVLAIAAARLHGALEIVATDVVPQPLEIARTLGADRTIDMRADPEALSEYQGTIDVMIECSGNERALAAGLAVMHPCGTVVQVGLGGEVSLPQSTVVAREITLKGSFRFRDEFGIAVSLLDSGRANLDALITHRFPMQDAVAAFDQASDRTRAMKVQLTF